MSNSFEFNYLTPTPDSTANKALSMWNDSSNGLSFFIKSYFNSRQNLGEYGLSRELSLKELLCLNDKFSKNSEDIYPSRLFKTPSDGELSVYFNGIKSQIADNDKKPFPRKTDYSYFKDTDSYLETETLLHITNTSSNSYGDINSRWNLLNGICYNLITERDVFYDSLTNSKGSLLQKSLSRLHPLIYSSILICNWDKACLSSIKNFLDILIEKDFVYTSEDLYDSTAPIRAIPYKSVELYEEDKFIQYLDDVDETNINNKLSDIEADISAMDIMISGKEDELLFKQKQYNTLCKLFIPVVEQYTLSVENNKESILGDNSTEINLVNILKYNNFKDYHDQVNEPDFNWVKKTTVQDPLWISTVESIISYQNYSSFGFPYKDDIDELVEIKVNQGEEYTVQDALNDLAQLTIDLFNFQNVIGYGLYDNFIFIKQTLPVDDYDILLYGDINNNSVGFAYKETPTDIINNNVMERVVFTITTKDNIPFLSHDGTYVPMTAQELEIKSFTEYNSECWLKTDQDECPLCSIDEYSFIFGNSYPMELVNITAGIGKDCSAWTSPTRFIKNDEDEIIGYKFEVIIPVAFYNKESEQFSNEYFSEIEQTFGNAKFKVPVIKRIHQNLEEAIVDTHLAKCVQINNEAEDSSQLEDTVFYGGVVVDDYTKGLYPVEYFDLATKDSYGQVKIQTLGDDEEEIQSSLDDVYHYTEGNDWPFDHFPEDGRSLSMKSIIRLLQDLRGGASAWLSRGCLNSISDVNDELMNVLYDWNSSTPDLETYNLIKKSSVSASATMDILNHLVTDRGKGMEFGPFGKESPINESIYSTINKNTLIVNSETGDKNFNISISTRNRISMNFYTTVQEYNDAVDEGATEEELAALYDGKSVNIFQRLENGQKSLHLESSEDDILDIGSNRYKVRNLYANNIYCDFLKSGINSGYGYFSSLKDLHDRVPDDSYIDIDSCWFNFYADFYDSDGNGQIEICEVKHNSIIARNKGLDDNGDRYLYFNLENNLSSFLPMPGYIGNQLFSNQTIASPTRFLTCPLGAAAAFGGFDKGNDLLSMHPVGVGFGNVAYGAYGSGSSGGIYKIVNYYKDINNNWQTSNIHNVYEGNVKIFPVREGYLILYKRTSSSTELLFAHDIGSDMASQTGLYVILGSDDGDALHSNYLSTSTAIPDYDTTTNMIMWIGNYRYNNLRLICIAYLESGQWKMLSGSGGNSGNVKINGLSRDYGRRLNDATYDSMVDNDYIVTTSGIINAAQIDKDEFFKFSLDRSRTKVGGEELSQDREFVYTFSFYQQGSISSSTSSNLIPLHIGLAPGKYYKTRGHFYRVK